MTDQSSQTASGEPGLTPGTRLCLSCGICCRGAIYPSALLNPNEVEKAEGLNVEIQQTTDGQDLFRLPCPHHNGTDNTCTIYDSRFKVCGRYECDLLKKLLNGDIDPDAAVALARGAREIEMRIYEKLGGRDPSKTVWVQLHDHLEASGIQDAEERNKRFAALLLDARMLSLLLHRHFESRTHQKLNANTGISATDSDNVLK